MSGYSLDYDSSLLRGDQDPRPWDIVEVIRGGLMGSGHLLDVGCGTAVKTLRLVDRVSSIVGLDPSPEMLGKARFNVTSQIALVRGRGEGLPFPNGSFDYVTCILALHDILEISRVLKPGGIAVVETMGDRDKWNIKQEFGSDHDGPRGQHAQLEPGELVRRYEIEFGLSFLSVEIRNGFWQTFYTLEGLSLLLEQTPAIRGFNRKRDRDALARVEARFMTPRGIRTEQNHILIIARK